MKRIGSFIVGCAMTILSGHAQLTLDYCLGRASENYPAIKKYKLIENTTEISLSDINKGWLPHVGVFAQGTLQNSVTAFPEFLSNMLTQNGVNVAGMKKFQYKGGVEVSQTIWDGGASKARREIERASGEIDKTSLDVELYTINERVENLFFGVLLLEEQIARVESTIQLLQGNLDRVSSMVRNGTAIQADADMIEAQILDMHRQLTEAKAVSNSYRAIMSIYMNEEVGSQILIRPQTDMPLDMESARPELTLFDKQIQLLEARRKTIKASLMPKIGFFAQAYYGYPGFNMFKGIMEHTPTFNVMGGVSVSWDIDSFYTRKNSNQKLNLSADMIRNNREVFLFNSKINSEQQVSKIDEIKDVMRNDARIVELRKNVRVAAESQLKNGIIDMTALLSKINDENQAELTASYHEIQLLQNIYKLKYTLNR